MAGFQHDIAGGSGDLIIAQLQSPDFSIAAKTGWAIMQDGDAYFYDITAEGSISSNTVIVSGAGEGLYAYSGTPAAGNLIATAGITAAGTDSSGNHYLAGHTTYSATTATQLSNGIASFYTGTLAGGWTARATLQFTSAGVIVLSGGLETQNNTLDDGDGNANIAGDLVVEGNVEATGTACVLSGGATVTAPTAAPARTALGATWNATTASECNANFVQIINTLGSLGLFT